MKCCVALIFLARALTVCVLAREELMFLEIASIHASVSSLSCYSAYRQCLVDISSNPSGQKSASSRIGNRPSRQAFVSDTGFIVSLSHATAPDSGAPPVAYIGLGLCWRSNISFKLQSMGVLYSARARYLASMQRTELLRQNPSLRLFKARARCQMEPPCMTTH